MKSESTRNFPLVPSLSPAHICVRVHHPAHSLDVPYTHCTLPRRCCCSVKQPPCPALQLRRDAASAAPTVDFRRAISHTTVMRPDSDRPVFRAQPRARACVCVLVIKPEVFVAMFYPHGHKWGRRRLFMGACARCTERCSPEGDLSCFSKKKNGSARMNLKEQRQKSTSCTNQSPDDPVCSDSRA